MFQRLWVRIPTPYTGWTLICCKICNEVCLKRPKINDKRGRGWPFLKEVVFQSVSIWIPVHLELMSQTKYSIAELCYTEINSTECMVQVTQLVLPNWSRYYISVKHSYAMQKFVYDIGSWITTLTSHNALQVDARLKLKAHKFKWCFGAY